MIIEKNGWCSIDKESMAYFKELGNRTFKFIKAIWLDTVEGDTRSVNGKDKTDNYVVVADTININNLSQNDIDCAISGHYDTLDDVKVIYGEATDEIVAEYYFDDESSF